MYCTFIHYASVLLSSKTYSCSTVFMHWFIVLSCTNLILYKSRNVKHKDALDRVFVLKNHFDRVK